MKLKYVYIDGKYRPASSSHISITTHAFNYGTAAFEGLRANYRDDLKTWVLFRPDKHFSRLGQSARMLEISLSMTLADFVDIIAHLLKKNNLKRDMYIRPLAFRNAAGVGLFKKSGHSLAVYLHDMPLTKPKDFTACFVSKRRPTDGSYSAKVTGNYVLSFLSQREASRRGCDLGILLSSDGYVSEASAMNLFFVDNGKLFTPALSCGPLAGITRETVITLAREKLKLTVNEGKYRRQRPMAADEIFLTGTGSGISSITRLEKRKLPKGRGDSVARDLWQLYSGILLGKYPDEYDWLTPVE